MSKCTLNVQEISFFIEQRCTIRGYGGFGGHQHTYVKKLVQNRQPGPRFGEGGFQTELLLDL